MEYKPPCAAPPRDHRVRHYRAAKGVHTRLEGTTCRGCPIIIHYIYFLLPPYLNAFLASQPQKIMTFPLAACARTIVSNPARGSWCSATCVKYNFILKSQPAAAPPTPVESTPQGITKTLLHKVLDLVRLCKPEKLNRSVGFTTPPQPLFEYRYYHHPRAAGVAHQGNLNK